MAGVLALAAAIIGCEDPPNIAATCTAPAMGCDDGLTCETAIPGGYCTKACVTQGSRAECPSGSVCDDAAGTGALLCSRTCQTQSDCRGDLECNGTTGSSVKICKAKL
jgi:hypothetical protein